MYVRPAARGSGAARALLDACIAFAEAREGVRQLTLTVTEGNLPALRLYRAAGFDFVAVGSDLGLFMQGARSAIAALRTPGSEHVHSVSSGTRGY